MKALVTGASGFIGSHLCSYLQTLEIEVIGVWHKKKIDLPKIKSIKLNLLRQQEIETVILRESPDYIFHLAGQTLILPSWQNPQKTFRDNIFSTLNILEAVKKTKIPCRVIIFGSASEYEPTSQSIKENFCLLPNSPYALSKIVQDQLGLLYFKSYQLDVVRIRPFFIIGLGKISDASSDFARRIAAIEKGKEKRLKVGNLSGIREYVDIKDAVRGIWLIAKKGTSGEVYNLCSGKPVKVQELLNKLISLSPAKVKVVNDKKLFRPIDESIKVGDNAKITKLGWQPKISLDESLKNILNYWRKPV